MGTENPTIRFFKIATHQEWWTVMKDQQAGTIGFICDRHFANDCFDHKRNLIREAVPTIFEHEKEKAKVKVPETCASCPEHIEMIEKLTTSLIQLQEQHNATLEKEMSLRKIAEKLQNQNEKFAENIESKNGEIVALKSALNKEIKNNNGLNAIIMILEKQKLLTHDDAKHLNVNKFFFLF